MNAAQYALVKTSYNSYKSITQKVQDAFADGKIPITHKIATVGYEELDEEILEVEELHETNKSSSGFQRRGKS